MKSEEKILEEVLKMIPIEILIKELLLRGFSEEEIKEELRKKGVKI